MAQLQLRVLGGFLLRDAARPRPLPARKAQALLAYLALRRARAHPRASLTALLWSETGDKQSRQSLRQTMVRLRRTLASAHRTALVVQGDTVTLDPAALDVDAVQFERLVRRGTPQALEAAVGLYQGPLLDGFRVAEPAFEEWLESERARLHELAIEALRRLLARNVRTGRVEPALQAASRLVALDPLQEDAQRTLMRLYARQGRRAAALRQYQACVAIQQKELGVEPEPETKRLYLEILQRAAPGGGRAARAGASSSARTAPAREAPFIGRDAELQRLRQRLREASGGRGQVVLVSGEAGIGKSRLVEELAATAATEGGRILLGRAYESEQILPFRPWRDALRSGRVVARTADSIAGSRVTRVELARLFPELADGEPPPPVTAEGYLRLFETIDALLAGLAHEGPLLVVLEDLHWADEMSLRLLPFIGRRLADRPLLLVATMREGEEPAGLQRVVTEVTSLPHAEQVSLGGLSKTDTAALVRALARAGSGDARLTEVVGKVWALSEGSPFVIVETVRALREGRLPDDRGGELPRRVRDMIAAGVERLSPRAQEVARVASVFTREFEFPVLQPAALEYAQHALEDAARAGDEVTMGLACYALARATYITGRSREGIAHGRQAVALLERSDERSFFGQALWALAAHLLHIGDFHPALETIARMQALGESLGEIRLQSSAAWTTGRIYTVMGEAESAIASLSRAVTLAVDPVGRANAVGWLGAAHLEAGDAPRRSPCSRTASRSSSACAAPAATAVARSAASLPRS